MWLLHAHALRTESSTIVLKTMRLKLLKQLTYSVAEARSGAASAVIVRLNISQSISGAYYELMGGLDADPRMPYGCDTSHGRSLIKQVYDPGY